MAELGREVLRAQGVTNMADISLGFHRPPFTSVDHLHLHVLAPASQILAHLSHKSAVSRRISKAFLSLTSAFSAASRFHSQQL